MIQSGSVQSELLGELVAHGLALDAIRLLQRRHVAPLERLALFRGHPTCIGYEAIDQRDFSAAQVTLVDKGPLRILGMNTRHNPAAAEYAAAASPALPAVESEIVLAPSAFARVIAADCPRALNELVGLSDSSLMKSRSRPTAGPNRRA